MARSTTIFCILDALDECEPTDLDPFVRWIKSYLGRSTFSTTQTSAYIKFIVTIRDLPSIPENFSNSSKTDYTQTSIEDPKDSTALQKDIDKVMNDRFHQAVTGKELDNETQKIIRSALQKAGEGQRTYMWVNLMSQALEDKCRTAKKDWETLLSNPPKTVFDAYELVLKRVDARDHPLVRSMFHVMYCADRPFTLQEMSLAVHLRQTENAVSEKDVNPMSDQACRNWVIETCGFFRDGLQR